MKKNNLTLLGTDAHMPQQKKEFRDQLIKKASSLSKGQSLIIYDFPFKTPFTKYFYMLRSIRTSLKDEVKNLKSKEFKTSDNDGMIIVTRIK